MKWLPRRPLEQRYFLPGPLRAYKCLSKYCTWLKDEGKVAIENTLAFKLSDQRRQL